MTHALPRLTELTAPAAWRVVDFISDLHLQETEHATWQAWADYMGNTRADAVFILGDLFEVWVGDDVLEPPASGAAPLSDFENRCAAILKATSQRCPVFFMHGNRDFLFGAPAAQRCGVTLLDDPTVLQFGQQRWLLSHGDALCLDDTTYQQFRQQVRGATWQTDFLAQPLAQRIATAKALRAQSQDHQRQQTVYADVDAPAALAWLQAALADTLIHGHTHRTAEHALGATHTRWVLSDWDARAQPARTQVLRLTAQSDQVRMARLDARDAR